MLWDPSFSSLALPLSHRGILPRSHSLVQYIPLCSNYEKECSFATRRGTHNGQRTTRNYYRPTDSLSYVKHAGDAAHSAPLFPLSPSHHTSEFLIRGASSRAHRLANLAGKHFRGQDNSARLARRCVERRRLAFLITVMARTPSEWKHQSRDGDCERC